MKSQINTDIFLETGCIKRDLLLNYRDDNLSDTQKHEVEEHLIDCPLCADALEGLMLVTGTAALDDIHSKVGSITEKPAGAGSFSYWAIAASITAVMLLSVFTYMQFKNANEPELAVAEKSISEEVVAEPTLPQSHPIRQFPIIKMLLASNCRQIAKIQNRLLLFQKFTHLKF
jgi:hypothetical protein